MSGAREWMHGALPGAGRASVLPLLCREPAVLDQARAHAGLRALVRAGELVQAPPRVEPREQLAVLVFRPGLAGLGRQLLLATLEALGFLQCLGRRVQRAHGLRALVGALGRE